MQAGCAAIRAQHNLTTKGRNCTVLDACELTLGNNVVIGPNVSFYTTAMTTDPRRRNGDHGLCTGKSIVIEDDVFIGGSAVIWGGEVGKGITVHYKVRRFTKFQLLITVELDEQVFIKGFSGSAVVDFGSDRGSI
ncbi:hypothetical protein F5883DRAFT_719316 [Diaporthe sp. PMI_573]|nr:hypothetical protein F5883DRAFT_719316 [Diaporthaceae sp. PMI_573]